LQERLIPFWLAVTAFSPKEVYIAIATINYQDCTIIIKPSQTKHEQQPSNFQNNTISSLAIPFSIDPLFPGNGGEFIADKGCTVVLRAVSPTNHLAIFQSSCPPEAGGAKGKGRRWMAEGAGQLRLLKP
jgi:hypothetical protein